MNKDEVFSIWAPEDSPWSPWAKPVLFAHINTGNTQPLANPVQCDVGWCPPPNEKVALVLDLPGAEGVQMALDLGGYRPVPLYNAVPLPFDELEPGALSLTNVAAVDVLPIIAALRAGTAALAKKKLPVDAPPAFLLDANRGGGGREMELNEFDNRSFSFTTDFPSANCLAAHGINRVILVQRGPSGPQADLLHSLCRWQDAGFVLERKSIDAPGPIQTLKVVRPAWYRAMFQRMLLMMRLRRSSAGGFGAWVPESASGG